MTLYLTRKQYELLVKVIPIMREFFSNNIKPLFEEVAKEYGTEPAIETACWFFESKPVTGPVEKYVKALTVIEDCVKKAEDIRIHTTSEIETDPFVKKVFVPNTTERPTNRDVLIEALDAYSRILMGQFFIIYEQLDINSENPKIQEAWASAKWRGTGVCEMRDMLIPDLTKMGWNSSYGITNPQNPYDSKLSYEMLKRIRDWKDDYILRVTDQPLIRVEDA